MTHPSRRHRRSLLMMVGLVLALAMAACGADDTADPADTADAPDDVVEATDDDSAEVDAAVDDDAREDSPADEPDDVGQESFSVAYLSASSANTWLQTSLAAMTEVADANDVTITEFDAQFTPGVQSQQIQDILVADTYDAIVIAAIDGAGIIPDLEEALDAGLEVAILNQVVGEDLDTADPQFDGPVVSAMAPPLRSGERMGELTLQACEGLSPCNVVYFYGIQGIPLDNALKAGFDDVTSANPDIEIVAEAEGQYLGPDVALAAMQDVLQRTEDIDVVVGPDQSMQGVLLALQDEGIDDVAIIGLGGSEPAIEGIRDGTWFGTVFGAPADEGRIVMEALLAAFGDGTVTGGVDPLTELPDEGLVTADNVDNFEPQWAG